VGVTGQTGKRFPQLAVVVGAHWISEASLHSPLAARIIPNGERYLCMLSYRQHKQRSVGYRRERITATEFKPKSASLRLQKMTIAELRDMISRVIDDLGGDSYAQRFSRDGWNLHHASARGIVGIAPNPESPGTSGILVAFRIVRMPSQGAEALTTALLDINFRLAGTSAFGVEDSQVVWLLCGRKMEGISDAEIRTMISETARAADHFGSELIRRFGQDLALPVETSN
jgi:hypothetical protein